jgi:hypothetical protein
MASRQIHVVIDYCRTFTFTADNVNHVNMEKSHASDDHQKSAASANSKNQDQAFPLGKKERLANSSYDGGRPQVDPGALALAAVAAAATLILAEGDWDLLDSAVGVLLLAIFLAHHRPVSGPTTARSWLLRGVFGATVAIALGIIFAWPIQDFLVGPFLLEFIWSDESDQIGAVADKTTFLVTFVWFVIAPIIAWCEPRISARLDKRLKVTSE